MLESLKKHPYGSFAPIFPEARIVSLHCMISGCGYCLEKSVKYSWDGLKRGEKEFTIFQYTISGLGILEYEGKEYSWSLALLFSYMCLIDTAIISHLIHQNGNLSISVSLVERQYGYGH